MKLSYWEEFSLLMWREIVGLKVEPLKIWVMIFQCVFQALLCLALFFGQTDLS